MRKKIDGIDLFNGVMKGMSAGELIESSGMSNALKGRPLNLYTSRNPRKFKPFIKDNVKMLSIDDLKVRFVYYLDKSDIVGMRKIAIKAMIQDETVGKLWMECVNSLENSMCRSEK